LTDNRIDPVSGTARVVSALHLVSGDLWAGAEAQVDLLLARLSARNDVEVSALVFNEGRLSERLASHGLRVAVTPERGQSLGALARGAAELIADTGATVIHSHGYKESFVGVAARLSIPRSRRPFHVRTQHGAPEVVAPSPGLKSRAYLALDRLVVRHAVDRVIAVSREIEARLAARVGASRVTRIVNGIEAPVVDAERAARARRLFGAGGGALLVGAAGRFQKVKGYDVLIDAFGLVPLSIDARLVLFGDGPERAALEARAGAHPDPSRVVFAGHVDDIASGLAAVDLLVVPSRHEGMPMTLLEGMALGRAIVASNVGGIPEAVVDGVSGVLVAPEDPAALAAAIVRLLGDAALRERLGTAARERALAEFSADRMARETAALYHELTGGAR